MAVEATVEPEAGTIPDGTAVVAVERVKAEVERRDRRAPMPTPSATGIMSGGKVTLTGLEPDTAYILFPVIDEIQKVTVKAKKGKVKLKVTAGGQTKETAGIKFNATAKEAEEALEALSNVGAGGVKVEGGPGSESGATPYTVKFLKGSAGLDVALMEAVTTELEESPKEVTIETTTAGTGLPPEAASSCAFRTPKS